MPVLQRLLRCAEGLSGGLVQVLDMAGMQCVAHHSFEPHMQPGMGMGMGMGMPMQMHLPVASGYPPAHLMYPESVIAGYPVMPIMNVPY